MVVLCPLARGQGHVPLGPRFSPGDRDRLEWRASADLVGRLPAAGAGPDVRVRLRSEVVLVRFVLEAEQGEARRLRLVWQRHREETVTAGRAREDKSPLEGRTVLLHRAPGLPPVLSGGAPLPDSARAEAARPFEYEAALVARALAVGESFRLEGEAAARVFGRPGWRWEGGEFEARLVRLGAWEGKKSAELSFRLQRRLAAEEGGVRSVEGLEGAIHVANEAAGPRLLAVRAKGTLALLRAGLRLVGATEVAADLYR